MKAGLYYERSIVKEDWNKIRDKFPNMHNKLINIQRLKREAELKIIS